MNSQRDYADEATDQIVVLLRQHHALLHPELESRLAERWYKGNTRNIDPHITTQALRRLTADGTIRYTAATTRGNHRVRTITLTAPLKGTKTAIARAEARKRLLYARYQGWAQGTKRHPQGLIGPAGEKAVRDGLSLSGALQPAMPGFAETTTLLNVRLLGPVDSAGYLVPIIAGLPQAPITVLVEVKNIRSWVYPSSIETLQVLLKSQRLQLERPEAAVIPMLFCRRAHLTTFWMAQQLGFVVVELDTQYAGDVPEHLLDEVRNELHFTDLRIGSGPSLRVRDRLQSTNLITQTPRIAQKWKDTALDPATKPILEAAWKNRSNHGQRSRHFAPLRAWSNQRGDRGGW